MALPFVSDEVVISKLGLVEGHPCMGHRWIWGLQIGHVLIHHSIYYVGLLHIIYSTHVHCTCMYTYIYMYIHVSK